MIFEGAFVDCVKGRKPTEVDRKAIAQFKDYLAARAEYEDMGMKRERSTVAACLRIYGTPFGEEK
jgi:hypothetical protein